MTTTATTTPCPPDVCPVHPDLLDCAVYDAERILNRMTRRTAPDYETRERVKRAAWNRLHAGHATRATVTALLVAWGAREISQLGVGGRPELETLGLWAAEINEILIQAAEARK